MKSNLPKIGEDWQVRSVFSYIFTYSEEKESGIHMQGMLFLYYYEITCQNML
jgi:hypothetical protein